MNGQLRTCNFKMRITGFIFIWIGLLQPVSLVAQQSRQNRAIEAKIIDGSTKTPLPYATIYVSPNHGTISNGDGEFTINATPADVLRISYVGYESAVIQANNIPAVIELHPYSIQLSEVIVKPVNLNKLVQQVFDKYKKQIEEHKKQESAFFYRQTTRTNAEYNEIMETFFNAKSVMCLRDMHLVAGRYAKLEEDSIHKYITFTNFFQYSQLTPIRTNKLKKKETIVPLMSDFTKYYTLSYDVLSSKDNTIYKIIFTLRSEEISFVLGGSLYVDSSTLDIIRVEVSTSMPVTIRNGGKVTTGAQSDLNVVINYKLIEHVSIVETVNVYSEFKVDTTVYRFNSILYNMGDKIKNEDRKSSKSNMLEAVAGMNYDPSFWKGKSIIKRTPLEASAVEMFEKENVFGTYSLEE